MFCCFVSWLVSQLVSAVSAIVAIWLVSCLVVAIAVAVVAIAVAVVAIAVAGCCC